MIELRNEYSQKAINELASATQSVLELKDLLLPLVDARDRLEITAPVDGEIVNLRVHSEGGVIKPGEPLLEIVPALTTLIIEAPIPVNEITHVHLGQECDIQLSAFERHVTPKVNGEVTYISADRVVRSSAAGDFPCYLVHIEPDDIDIKEKGLYLSPGMPVEAFLVKEPRTIIDFIVEPLSRNFNHALK
ncbi:MAG: HlyD family efflux transporter periplasmic adaptor subunit [Chitinivibrionales bacterium]|nr:HlyD family efflux transporter periplasmic adaptor subunit [Chitinivibrionales bacterium]MBD3358996.1 HlyD family efflux transporter periplasmic adaptor subunit [Chitinivibrionales bacterium]